AAKRAVAERTTRTDRGLHARAALLHRLCAELARARATRATPHARDHRSARTRAVARQWATVEHSGVRAGVWLQASGSDGSAQGEGAEHLVATKRGAAALLPPCPSRPSSS